VGSTYRPTSRAGCPLFSKLDPIPRDRLASPCLACFIIISALWVFLSACPNSSYLLYITRAHLFLTKLRNGDLCLFASPDCWLLNRLGCCHFTLICCSCRNTVGPLFIPFIAPWSHFPPKKTLLFATVFSASALIDILNPSIELNQSITMSKVFIGFVIVVFFLFITY
jgi:hypothetical protein